MKAEKYAIPDSDGHSSHIKKGKTYKVIDFYETSFTIKSPISGRRLFCLKNRCAHLGGGSWTIIDKPKNKKMKKAKKEFILKAHKDACEDYKRGIEKHWPELFPKEEFKVGDWLINISGGFCTLGIGELFRVVGFQEGRKDSPKGEKCYANGWYYASALRKATKEEIETHLIAEAKKRGYKVGVTIDKSNIPDYNKVPKKTWKILLDGFDYDYERDLLVMGSDYIYEKGQWAEIIEQTPKDLQDLICKYGKEKIKEYLDD